jgi:hypothetical protein
MRVIIALLLCAFTSANGATASSLPIENISSSDLSRVAQSRYWQLLLGMRPRLLGGVKGVPLEGDFYFSPEGRHNPLAELKANIEAFGQNRQVGFFKQHPQCAFPERFRYLTEVLHLKIAKVPCADFEEWIEGLSPDSATLVYSAGFENNPSSVFGHTLLRINAKTKPGQDRKDLLDYGVSYAAAAGDESGLEFAVRGLFGGYFGAFEILPYYMKVNLYNHAENRDVWEYDLNLTAEQVRRMLGHLWELRSSAILNYYFIDENCAYQILVLLEIANENWRLVDKMPWYVIPSDTVKAVTKEPGAVKNTVFRPSIYKKLASQYHHLKTDQQRSDFFGLVDLKLDPQQISDVEVMDTALTQFQYIKSKANSNLTPMQSQYFKNLLIRRSQFPTDQNKQKMNWGQEDAMSRPDDSHGSFQVGALGGLVQNKFSQQLHFRMGLHDLMNNDMGLPKNSVFEWVGVKMRNIDNAGLTLDQVDFLNLKSIFSRNRLQKLYSWKVNFQYRTPKDMDCGSCKTGFVEAAGGIGSDLTKDFTTYALLGLSVDVGNPFGLGYRTGPIAEAGAIYTLKENWKLGLSVQTMYDLTDKDGRQSYSEILFEQGYSLSTTWDLRSRVYFIPEIEGRRSYTEGFVGANYYFF